MKKMMRSAVSLALAVLLLMSSLCLSASAEGYSVLTEETPLRVELSDSEQTVVATFTPTQSGVYRIYSKSDGSCDPYASLYIDDMLSESVVSGDDDGVDGNWRDFSFMYAMAADETYYVTISNYAGESSFDVYAERVVLNTNQMPINMTMQGEFVIDYTPAASGTYALYVNGDATTEVLIRQGSTPLSDGGNDYDYLVIADLTAGQTYSITVSDPAVTDDPDSVSMISLSLSVHTVTAADEGVSTVTVDDTVGDVLAFIPDQDGFYQFSSSNAGDADPIFYMFDVDGVLIDSVDDLRGRDFIYGAELEGGTTYYLYPHTFSHNEGSYEFTFGNRTFGWRYDSSEGSYVYYNTDGTRATNCWKQNGEHWCYLDADGRALTDQWKQDSAGWLYFDNVGLNYIDNAVYIFNFDAETVDIYVFNKAGYMVSNDWYNVKADYGDEEYSYWYYLGADGKALTDQWKKDSKGWVYLSVVGIMYTNEWVEDSAGLCYVGSDGYCVTDKWIDCYDAGWRYIDAAGHMVTNQWKQDSTGWLYLGDNGLTVMNEWVKDSHGWCYLGADGYMKTNAWVRDSVGWCYVGADGYCVTNQWKKDSIGWCYLDANGRMATNQWVRDSVGWCYVDADGYMVTSTYVNDSNGRCWIDANGYWDGIYR